MSVEDITVSIDYDIWTFPALGAAVAVGTIEGRTDPFVVSEGLH